MDKHIETPTPITQISYRITPAALRRKSMHKQRVLYQMNGGSFDSEMLDKELLDN